MIKLHFLLKNIYQHLPTVRAPLYPAVCIFFTPFFSAVYNQERLILQTILVHKQGKLGIKSAVYNQERVMMARVW